MPKQIIEGNIPAMVQYICSMVDRTKNTDPKYIYANLVRQFPQLTDKKLCANCGAKMEASVYSPDILDALLLLKIGQAVREKQLKGVPFTEANLVHVPTLGTTDAIRHRTTRCSYLNYIKQPEGKSNSGYWLVTAWGWKALRGEPVPKSVVMFRGKKLERGTETITLSEMFRTHTDKVKAALTRRAIVANDYTADVSGYNPADWAEVGKVQQGILL